jgi:hypothetical protein
VSQRKAEPSLDQPIELARRFLVRDLRIVIGIGEPLDEECLAAGFAEDGLEDRGLPAALRLPEVRRPAWRNPSASG